MQLLGSEERKCSGVARFGDTWQLVVLSKTPYSGYEPDARSSHEYHTETTDLITRIGTYGCPPFLAVVRLKLHLDGGDLQARGTAFQIHRNHQRSATRMFHGGIGRYAALRGYLLSSRH